MLRRDSDVANALPEAFRNSHPAVLVFITLQMFNGPIPEYFQELYAAYHRSPTTSIVTSMKTLMGGSSSMILVVVFDLLLTWIKELLDVDHIGPLYEKGYATCELPEGGIPPILFEWLRLNYHIIAPKVSALPMYPQVTADTFNPNLTLIRVQMETIESE